MTVDLRDTALTAEAVRHAFSLRQHPAGGYSKEMYAVEPAPGERFAVSIELLLAAGEQCHWHREHSAKVWLWQAGSPLLLNENGMTIRLGPGPDEHGQLQWTILPQIWQSARSLGAWTLASCVMVPSVERLAMELAPLGWSPENRV